MKHLAEKFPYRNTKIFYEQSRVDISQMLKEAGALAINWKDDELSMKGEVMPELSFMLEVTLSDRQIKIAVRIRPPLLMDKKRMYVKDHYRHEMVNTPNRNASMRLLYWYLKSRLEAVRFNMEDIFEAFMSKILHELPDGKIVTHAEVIKEHPDVLADILPEFEIRSRVKALPQNEVQVVEE